MIIDCIADLHGSYIDMPGGDLLIVAGDLTKSDKSVQYMLFREWLLDQNYRMKVFIAGNHDGCIEHGYFYFNDEWMGAKYLKDSGVEFEGFKIWGSPWTPQFSSWHFMLKTAKSAREKRSLIPEDTDILITHGPPYGVLDKTEDGENAGCKELDKRLLRIQPKLHVFGHIHEGYGQDLKEYPDSDRSTIFVNASHMTEDYKPVNKPIRIELTK